jgi:hypothetical protein
MSVFAATSFWNIQPVEVGPPPGPSFAVRTDPYSASLVLAMPFANFSELGMTSYTQSLDGLIRTGNQANSYKIRATGSSAAYLYPSASTVSFSSSLWSDEGYTSSMAIQNAQNAGTYVAELSSNSFVVEFWINVQGSFTNPPFHGHIFGQNAGDALTIQYSSTPQFRFYVNTANTWSTTPNFNLGTNNQNWKHVAIVKSGTNAYVYVNGTRIGVGTRAATINSGQANQFILGTNSNNDGLFRLIQDYRVYVGTDKGYTGATITVPQSIVDQT